MTDAEGLEVVLLDALDQAQQGKWRALLEAIRDDAFEVGLENLLGPDLPQNAYWDDATGVDQPLGPGGGPVWWSWRKNVPERHSFWQGKYAFASDPKTSEKRKKKAWASKFPKKPWNEPSPAKKAVTHGLEAARRDDADLELLILAGVL